MSKLHAVKETDLMRAKYLEAKRILKLKMEQEQRNSRANSLKIQTLWRKIMRINKVDSLRKEIEVSRERGGRGKGLTEGFMEGLMSLSKPFSRSLRSSLYCLPDTSSSSLLSLSLHSTTLTNNATSTRCFASIAPQVLSQNHERDVDRKDAIIQMLDRDLEEAEDQFGMALRAHLQNMDKLIDLQDARLLGLEQEFEEELQTLENEFDKERRLIVSQHSSEVKELNDIMTAIDAEEQEREAEARQEHEQLREEIRNKNLEEVRSDGSETTS